MCTEGTHQSQANKKAMTLTERSSRPKIMNPPLLKNSLDKWREHRPWVLFWSICSGSQMYLRLCSLPKRSCGAGDRVGCDRTHLTDPWDTWMPCGDVLNALIGQRRSVSLSGGWNLRRASVCGKSASLNPCRDFLFKWQRLFNFAFISLFSSRVNIVQSPCRFFANM